MNETHGDIERGRIAQVLEQQARSLMQLASTIQTRLYSSDPKEPFVPHEYEVTTETLLQTKNDELRAALQKIRFSTGDLTCMCCKANSIRAQEGLDA